MCKNDDKMCKNDDKMCKNDDKMCKNDDKMCKNDDKMCKNDDKMCNLKWVFIHNSLKEAQKIFPGSLESLHHLNSYAMSKGEKLLNFAL